MRHNLIVTVSNECRHVPFYIIIIVRDMDIHTYCFDYIHPTVLIESASVESIKTRTRRHPSCKHRNNEYNLNTNNFDVIKYDDRNKTFIMKLSL